MHNERQGGGGGERQRQRQRDRETERQRESDKEEEKGTRLIAMDEDDDAISRLLKLPVTGRASASALCSTPDAKDVCPIDRMCRQPQCWRECTDSSAHHARGGARPVCAEERWASCDCGLAV